MASPTRRPISAIRSFHTSLPGYAQTPLVALPDLAQQLGVKAVYVKDESKRCGLRSFKILGASWGCFRAVCAHLKIEPASTNITDLREYVRDQNEQVQIYLYTATEGNHGRAVGYMAALIGVQAHVFVPEGMNAHTRKLIENDGAQLHVVQGDYDIAVGQAAAAAATHGGLLVQDTAWDGYEEIPSWIVDGYSTLMEEIDEQLGKEGLHPSVVITPVGVGSLASAVAKHCKWRRHSHVQVVAVEPDTGACFYKSLLAGRSVTVKTTSSIMNGSCCGTLSSTAWDILRQSVDASVTVSDYESHRAVQYLESHAISAGPCGGSTLAALRHLVETQQDRVELNKDAVIVILSTEGSRPYPKPFDTSTDDPVTLTQILTQIDSSNATLSVAEGAGEAQIADYLAAWFEHRGIENHRIETVHSRPSVVGIVRGTGGGKSLMLNGHIDTVSLSSYEKDPLSGALANKNNRSVVLGRGSLDMKSGVAAMLSAALVAKYISLRGDIIIAAVADEEDASKGTIDVIEAGWRADAAVIPEPTQHELVCSHKGFVWIEIDIIGTASHGSMPSLGVDSIMHTGAFLTQLEAYQQKLPTDDLLGQASLHCGLINGGEEASSYPAKTTLTIEFRTIPSQSPQTLVTDMLALLQTTASLRQGFQFSQPRVTLSRLPMKIPSTHPFVQKVADTAKSIIGASPKVASMPFWCDAALLSEVGIPCVVFGPKGEGLHAKEEYVDVESIKQVDSVLAKLVQDYCQ
ncbi:putative diaminopropionate ammonia-lyase [Talaromyces proteolyticus]|uniref:Diaminopropionate ammonia-lyase n=1 Tax=Talaromyces proteolyticus TaxID=1131652 RepID=A0AAD4KKA0_9EURO|nr:putative diaminopropionate ammonia-lyase [Talaromyces proteolyticus]KAH8694245.1 putative diaminopropionate ammonia-lyase [Talaromyces proteolyticus]